jgi:hypothetical protein
MHSALPRDRIPAIVDPAFGPDWGDLDAPNGTARPLLPADAPVVGVERDGQARAYPLRILDWHEVVNDDLGGPLLVSYCVLCGSAVVAERRVSGQRPVFGVSGYLWRDDLVLYDSVSASLWSQILATAVNGPLTGEQLSLVPASLTTWGAFQRANPGGEVLLPPPHSNTVAGPERTFDYFDPKYSYGDEDQLIGYDAGGGLESRTLVVGIEHEGTATAYPFGAVREAGVVNDRVGDLPVVVTHTPADSMAAYVRRIDGETVTFEPDGNRFVTAAGSRWERETGRAVGGDAAGARLETATERSPMFWLGWSNFHPETAVYGRD